MLDLDPLNPRLAEEPGEGDQASITTRLWSHMKTRDIARDMRDGVYLGPPAMLGLPENGRTTVIDGNRQLAALRVLNDPDTFAATDAHQTLDMKWDDLPRPEDEPSAEVILMDSRQEAMRVRIRRQRTQGDLWGSLAHASHYRELLRTGMLEQEIYRLYEYGRIMPEQARVAPKINALTILEQLNEGRETPWTRSSQFQKLDEALRIPEVRKHLGLKEAAKYGPEDRPLTKRNLESAEKLMVWLNGSRDPESGKREPMFRDRQDITLLREICTDPKALELMDTGRFHSARSILSHRSGGRSHWEIKHNLESLEGRARNHLKEMKEDPLSPVLMPGDICVAGASYEMHRDDTVQYRVRLMSADPIRDEPVRAALQQALRQYDDLKCAVELGA